MNRKRMPKPSRPHADRRRLMPRYRPRCWCDHCGDECESFVMVGKLKQDINSACKGESALLCFTCHEQLNTGR